MNVLLLCAALLVQELPARVLEGRGERADVPAVLAALPAQPSAARRAELAHFLGRPDLGAEGLPARLDMLEALALQDAAREVREAAVAALAESWQRAAWERLDALLDRGDAELRPLVARTILERAHLAPLVVARLLAAAGAPGEDPRVLVPLVAASGRALADLPHGGEDPRERAALLALARAGDARVALAARGALEDLFNRLRALAEPERALSLARAFAAQGAEPDWCALQRAHTALLVGTDAADALLAARELLVRAQRREPRARTGALARARELEATSLLALGRPEEALAAARTLEAELERALARRDARGAGPAAEDVAEWTLRRARAGLVELLARLDDPHAADPAAPPAPELVAAARELHRWSLAAQLASLRAQGARLSSLDALLADADSPLGLWADDPWRAGRDRASRLELQARLARLLATVAPREMLGFAPWGAAEDPLEDPPRAALFEALESATRSDCEERLSRALTRVLRRARGDPLGVSPAGERELYELESERRSLVPDPAATAESRREATRELRAPSALALDLARSLRDEGRSEEARALASALETALEHDPAAQRFLWGVELRAECEELRGNTWSDAGQPGQAEVELAKALERLEALEHELEGRGVGPAARARLRSSRSGVLVGLAVNANVKQHDPAKALAYFERAWELRQDEFMKALRTCYLARAGRADEARGLLREIVPAPATLYNLACTWALLGDKAQALELLERDFDENLPTSGMRAKQQAWAREDPDLATLRGEKRFEALLAR